IEITASTQRSPVKPRRRVMILAPGQPIPHGRPYRYHPNGSVHMMTARKRVGPLPVQQLAVRHSVDHSSSDCFSLDDSARDSSSDLSSETSSDFHSDASSDSSSRHSLSYHSSPDLLSTSAGPSCKRRRSSITFVPALPPVSGALSPVCADLVPSPKRFRDIGYSADVEVGPRETRVERVTHPAMPKDIPKPAQEGAVEVTYETLGDLVQRFHDHTQAIPVHHIQVIKGVQREQNIGLLELRRPEGAEHRIVRAESAETALTERVAELERDNRRLRDTASVEKMHNTRPKASMTHEEVEELVSRRVAEEMEAREAARNLETLNENGDEQEGENGGNGGNGNRDNGGNKNGGNEGNGNGRNGENGNRGMNYRCFMPMARECTFQDFLKCKPHTFSRTEGVVRLTCWFKKIETVFNISNCPPKYQVKYATCTLHDSALTWWNSHKRTTGVDVAYAMKWARLMKLMTEVYYPRNEVQKMETELWNLTVKGKDLTAYTQRFQELILLCTRMVPDEEGRVERFIGGLPDNIQGTMIAANPARL
nr:hypothetical protein [Tanacetum cinerariifolium]